MTEMPPYLTHALDQARAAAALVVDHFLAADAIAPELAEHERWTALWAGAIDSGASRETLAGALATAVNRLTTAAAQVDRIYRDGYRTGREHSGADQLRAALAELTGQPAPARCEAQTLYAGLPHAGAEPAVGDEP